MTEKERAAAVVDLDQREIAARTAGDEAELKRIQQEREALPPLDPEWMISAYKRWKRERGEDDSWPS